MIETLLFIGIFVAYYIGKAAQREEHRDALMKHFGMKKK
jgi:hypothetical protein